MASLTVRLVESGPGVKGFYPSCRAVLDPARRVSPLCREEGGAGERERDEDREDVVPAVLVRDKGNDEWR